MGLGISNILDRDPAFFLDSLEERGREGANAQNNDCAECARWNPHRWDYLHSAAADFREGCELFETQRDYDLARIKFVQVLNKFYDNFYEDDVRATKRRVSKSEMIRSRDSFATIGKSLSLSVDEDEECKDATMLYSNEKKSDGRAERPRKSFLLVQEPDEEVRKQDEAATNLLFPSPSLMSDVQSSQQHQRRRKSNFFLPEWMEFLVSPARSISRSPSQAFLPAHHTSHHSTVVVVHDRDRLYSFLSAVRDKELDSRTLLREIVERHCCIPEGENVTFFHSHDHHDHEFTLSQSQKRFQQTRKSFDATMCSDTGGMGDFPVYEYLDVLQDLHARKVLTENEEGVYNEEKHRAIASSLLADSLLWLAMALEVLSALSFVRADAQPDEQETTTTNTEAVELSTIARLYESSLDISKVLLGTNNLTVAKTLGCYSSLLALQGHRVERDIALARVRDIIRLCSEESNRRETEECAEFIARLHRLARVPEPAPLISQ